MVWHVTHMPDYAMELPSFSSKRNNEQWTHTLEKKQYSLLQLSYEFTYIQHIVLIK